MAEPKKSNPKVKSSNYKGRSPGSRNKLSTEGRAVLADLKFDALTEMVGMYREARAEEDRSEASKLLVQIVKYQYPQLKAMDVQVENAAGTVFEVNMTGFQGMPGDGEDTA